MQRKPPLSADQIERARYLRAGNGLSWEAIGKHFDRNPETIKRYVDEGYRLQRNRQVSDCRRSRAKIAGTARSGCTPFVRHDEPERRNPRFDPRRDGSPIYRTEFSEMLGEPPVGRSALDQKMRAIVSS